jgi:glucose-6-phosphate 1-dehydrogenase
MKDGIIKGGGVKDDEAKLGPFIDRVQYYAMNFDDDAGYIRA